LQTVGVDLASAAGKTSWCRMSWHSQRGSVDALELGADDERLVACAEGADVVGIDAPFGWPSAFVRMLQDAPRAMQWPDERDTLRFRATDHHVRERTGLWPLSVSSDLIGVVAMRCRGLLARLGAAGHTCFEVYPAAALQRWGIEPRGYKGAARRAALGERVDALLRAVTWLELTPEHQALVRSCDDAFDALLAALCARAAAVGLVDEQDRMPAGAEVAREGWIMLPSRSALARLANGS